MKARLENNRLLVDFNFNGWNPEYVTGMNDEEFETFISKCESEFENLSYMNLLDVVSVLLDMARSGEL